MEFASYVTGFVDGEGCFSVSLNWRKKMSKGIEVRPSFSISQNKRNLEVLKKIQDYFQCGGIRFCANDQTYKYEVRSVQDLVRKVIPHFEKYGLLTSKQNDFVLFKEICQKVYANQHQNVEQLRWIIEAAYKIKPSGKRREEKTKFLKHLDKMKI